MFCHVLAVVRCCDGQVHTSYIHDRRKPLFPFGRFRMSMFRELNPRKASYSGDSEDDEADLEDKRSKYSDKRDKHKLEKDSHNRDQKQSKIQMGMKSSTVSPVYSITVPPKAGWPTYSPDKEPKPNSNETATNETTTEESSSNEGEIDEDAETPSPSADSASHEPPSQKLVIPANPKAKQWITTRRATSTKTPRRRR
jgi:hypothetical protein